MKSELASLEKIEKLFDNLAKKSKVHEAALFIENSSKSLSWSKSYGGKTLDTPMLMASITKLFTTTCILILLEQKKISLKDKIHTYLNKDILTGIHVLKGKEYSLDLTIENLLFQTSGLPDFYLDGKQSKYQQVLDEDYEFTFEDEMEWIKEMTPHFAPGSKKKAYYTDANFDLLGVIIEKIEGKPLKQVLHERIFTPLGLQNTYLASSEDSNLPYCYYKEKKLHRPLFIQSSFAGGGGITTPRELMVFIKAFWSGSLFSKEVFEELSNSNPLQMSFYPIHYSAGYMKIKASLPFSKKSILIGHAGSTGSAAFYCPEKDIYIITDVAQMATPALPIRLVMRSVLSL